MFQYASDGYEVDAIDYCVKPITYSSLSLKLDKAVRVLGSRAGVPVQVKTKEGLRVLSSSDIRWIEVKGHDLMFHFEPSLRCHYFPVQRRQPLGGGHR